MGGRPLRVLPNKCGRTGGELFRIVIEQIRVLGRAGVARFEFVRIRAAGGSGFVLHRDLREKIGGKFGGSPASSPTG